MNRILLLVAFLFCLTAHAQRPVVLDPAYEHTKWGVEPANLIYHFASFTTSFDGLDDNDGDGDADAWRIPEWVAYEVKAQVGEHDPDVSPTWFTEDFLHLLGIAPDVDTYDLAGTNSMRVVKEDYRFIRAQMCPPNVAQRISEDAARNTHTLLNTVPQLQWTNRGVWRSLEENVLDWADRFGRIWVVCGPVFFGKLPSLWLGQDDEERAAVPDALFKIVIREEDREVKALAFLIPNILPKTQDDIWYFLTIIDQVEELTGIDFLTTLPEADQTALEIVSGDPAEW